MPNILIIEDDSTIVEAMEDTFKFHGFTVSIATDGNQGYQLFKQENPDLIILDVMLPGPDGFSICKKIREENQGVAIILLTAKSLESDKLLGFELGADDYITKPFSVKELIARVLAVLKRSYTQTSPSNTEVSSTKPVSVGSAIIDFKNFTVTRSGTQFHLSPKEYYILKLLVGHPDEVIDRNRIIDIVWGDDYFPSPRTIDNFILKLRLKLEVDPKKPRHILTLHGAGYKFRF